MHIDQYVATLQDDGERLAVAAGRAGLDAPVPACPGWTVADLLRHLGGVHRWATAHVVMERKEPFSRDEEQQFFQAPADAALLDWFREGHRALIVALASADPGLDCWTFLPAGSPREFWARRQAHETAVHRADAEAAGGSRPRGVAQFAADGIDELLDGFFRRRPQRLATDPPLRMTLSATDLPRAWTIRMETDRLYVDPGAQPTGLTLTGTASDLYLLLWNRAEPPSLEGDPAAWESWRDRATVTWS
ncbi:maleylpyruvate isomerase family mycothiol-dependent enzyme [Actinoplanes philippinensis]|uniref:maleylpyruvate isomerase family mycothiol-dependent enzyme n=1 Tax=Actinoplanes philippinensis TaxID=35752 RepID=UPI0033EF016B